MGRQEGEVRQIGAVGPILIFATFPPICLTSPSCLPIGRPSEQPCCTHLTVRSIEGAVEGRGGSGGVAGIYTMANCSGHQVMVKEDYWGLTSINYTEGRWQIIRQAKKGDRKAVEESYSSPTTDAACPEMSPGLEGGYIALGNKVV